MRRVLVCYIWACVLSVSDATAVERVNVAWLVDQALEQSSRLQAIRARYQRQQIQVDIAQDGRWPTLSGFVEQASASESRQQFRLSQNLYDWGTTAGKIDVAELEASQVELEFEQAIEEETGEILQLVLEWSLARDQKQVLQAHLMRLQELKRLTNLRVGNVIDRGELSRVSAAIAGAELEVALADGTLRESEDQIHDRIARKVDLNSLEELPPFRRWFIDEVSAQELARLTSDAPSVRVADLDVQKAQIDKRLAKSESLPTLSIDAIAERTEDRFGSDTDQRIALRIESPIFQGLSAFKRPKAAYHALTAAVRERDRKLSKVRRSVQRLVNSLRLQESRAPLIQRQVQASKETVDLYTRQFGIGRRDMSDLIGAESERVSAELAALDLQFERKNLTVRLSLILGLLTQKLNNIREGLA